MWIFYKAQSQERPECAILAHYCPFLVIEFDEFVLNSNFSSIEQLFFSIKVDTVLCWSLVDISGHFLRLIIKSSLWRD